MGWVYVVYNCIYDIVSQNLLIFLWSKAIYIYGIFQHQACVYQTKAQYDRSNMILTEMLSSPLCQDVLSKNCIKAIETFQCSMIDKETYLAFYVQKTISMSFDAMTTSPVESMNSSIKNGMGVYLNSNTRWVGRSLCIIHEFIYSKNSCMFWHIIYVLYAIRLCITDEFIERICFPVCVHSLMTLLFYYNSSNTLMKLATGSKQRITSFENAAQQQFECLYICNQNFDQRVHFNCVAVSDENWILWNFYERERDYTDISKQVPKFHDVHHVWVKTLLEQQFLKCDCLLYER